MKSVIIKNTNNISLGEGNTPLLRLNNLKNKLGFKGELWAKAEYQNPTGSFKDRGSLIEVSKAVTDKKPGVVCASTGNMAASLAAYATRAKLKCYVVVPAATSEAKLKQAVTCGAKLIKVNGNYDQCVTKAEKMAAKKNLLLCGDYEPRRLGQQSIGRELAKADVQIDSYVVPVGNGTVGCAIAEGFESMGLLPRFIGVSGVGADPITKAWESGSEIQAVDKPKTIAAAMKVGKPLDGKLTLKWLKKTKGMMVSVTDKEIKQAQYLLANNEGVYVELASAATLAGLIKVLSKVKGNTVLILTGSGLKEG